MVSGRTLVLALALALAPSASAQLPPTAVDSNRTETEIAPGVTYGTFDRVTGSGDRARVYVLEARLGRSGTRAGLLWPGAVAQREKLSDLATQSGAVAGINGDFFDIDKSNAPLGMAIDERRLLKSPDEFVKFAGVGTDGVGRLRDAGFAGTVALPGDEAPLQGLNRFKLHSGQIGAYDSRWGSYGRARTVDDSSSVTTAVVRDGRVAQVSDGTLEGPIAPDAVELVGREGGAARLASLAPGDRVTTASSPTFSSPLGAPFAFGLGGVSYLVRDGALVDAGAADGVDRPFYPRSGIGFSEDGRTMFLVLVDGRQATSTGFSRTLDFAKLMQDTGASDALHLDGGGSATMVVRGPRESQARVVNNPSDGAEVTGLPGTERPVPNGVGIFALATAPRGDTDDDRAGGAPGHGGGRDDRPSTPDRARRGAPCVHSTSTAGAVHPGHVRLGRERSLHRRTFGSPGRYRRFMDRYCLRAGGRIRIGYPSTRTLRRLSRSERRRVRRRATLILNSSRRARVGAVAVGAPIAVLRRRVPGLLGVRIGRNVWYTNQASGGARRSPRVRSARLVFKVARRRVREVGVADRRLTAGRARMRAFFHSSR